MRYESLWWKPYRELSVLGVLSGQDMRVINAAMHYAISGELFTWRRTLAERAGVVPEVVTRTVMKLVRHGTLERVRGGSWQEPPRYRFVPVSPENLRRRIAGSVAPDPERRRSGHRERRRSGWSRRSIDQEQGVKESSRARPPAAAAAAARHARGGSAPAPPKTRSTPEPRGPLADALRAAGVGMPVLAELAASPHLTPELVAKVAAKASRRGKGAGVVVNDLRAAAVAEGKRVGELVKPLDTLAAAWEATTSERRRELWGEFVRGQRERGNWNVPASPNKAQQREFVERNPALRKLLERELSARPDTTPRK